MILPDVILDAVDTADFVDRARARLHVAPPGPFDPTSNPRGDHSLNDPLPPLGAPPKPAAVLIPVVLHPGAATVLLTQRTASLRDHSGQIAFPGGKVDAEDGAPLVTALREAEEEIGLPRERVAPLGYLDAYLTGTNYFITPVVGLVEPGFTLALNPDEVADAFEVPLGHLLDPANYELHEREWKGQQRRFYAVPFGARTIWGATAGILRNLTDRLYGP